VLFPTSAGAGTCFVHDLRGVVTERVDPRGARVTFGLDALGRVTRQVDRNGDAVTTGYTPSGQVAGVRFPAALRGAVCTGRLIETTDSLGGRLRYAAKAGRATYPRRSYATMNQAARTQPRILPANQKTESC